MAFYRSWLGSIYIHGGFSFQKCLMFGCSVQGKINKHGSSMTMLLVALPPMCSSWLEIQVEAAGSSLMCTISTENVSDSSNHHQRKLDSSTYLFFQSEKLPLVLLGLSGGHFFSVMCGSESFWTRSSSTSLSTQPLNRGSGSLCSSCLCFSTASSRLRPNHSASSSGISNCLYLL